MKKTVTALLGVLILQAGAVHISCNPAQDISGVADVVECFAARYAGGFHF